MTVYIDRIRAEIRRSISDEYSPHQIASSFAIGVFITMLPTLGTGLIVFAIISYLSSWINKVALFASVLVLNPVVKWGVYAGSMALGILLLGPVPILDDGEVAVEAGQEVLVRLLVGNTILAVIATVLGYVIVYRAAERYQRSASEFFGTVIEELDEELS